ncbi:hypothetical protein VTK73DRAFT_2440 [Phialemonium thermophilum]|uniref:Uncharacterized protein n=1 Tax=Phialemonium thermophilum TaxID=223376 RepID=A0ABR3VS47_9PEZI
MGAPADYSPECWRYLFQGYTEPEALPYMHSVDLVAGVTSLQKPADEANDMNSATPTMASLASSQPLNSGETFDK